MKNKGIKQEEQVFVMAWEVELRLAFSLRVLKAVLEGNQFAAALAEMPTEQFIYYSH